MEVLPVVAGVPGLPRLTKLSAFSRPEVRSGIDVWSSLPLLNCESPMKTRSKVVSGSEEAWLALPGFSALAEGDAEAFDWAPCAEEELPTLQEACASEEAELPALAEDCACEDASALPSACLWNEQPPRKELSVKLNARQARADKYFFCNI